MNHTSQHNFFFFFVCPVPASVPESRFPDFPYALPSCPRVEERAKDG